MNKYFELLEKILNEGKMQTNKKGSNIYLLNETLKLSKQDLEAIFSEYKIPKKLLAKELDLYLKGEKQISKYEEEGIKWWDYCKPEFISSYPDYFKSLPKLIDKINTEKRASKNYILYMGQNDVLSNQQCCISLYHFQIPENQLTLSVFQRSCDSSLGLPCDLFQSFLIANKIDVPLKEICFNISNAHIYENNIEETRKMLKKEDYKFNLNV